MRFKKIFLPTLFLFTIPAVLSAETSISAPPTLELIEPTPTATPTPTPLPPLSDEQLGEFEILKSTTLSGRVAFTASIDGFERILLLDLDTRKISPLVNGPGNSSFPQWSPDGRSLIYTSDRDGNSEIFKANWKGENSRRLTSSLERESDPAWSPDGSRIVYYLEDNDRNSNVFSIGPEGESLTQITRFSGRNIAPRWSPDGRFISYSTNRFWPGWDICVWDIKAQAESCILTGRNSFFRSEWARSSDRLAYSYGTGDEVEIGIFSTRDNSQILISQMAGKEYDPVWAPNDNAIIFTAEDPVKPGVFNLFVHDLKSGKTSQLVRSPINMRYPTWNALTTLILETEELAAKHAAGDTPEGTPVPSITPLEMPDEYIPPYLQNKKLERKVPAKIAPTPERNKITESNEAEEYEAIEFGE